MKPRTLEEWCKLYKDKTGEEPVFYKGCRLFYLPSRGFAVMRDDEEGKMIIILSCGGDGQFYHDYAELIAKSKGYPVIATMCIRHIKPYVRAFGWAIEKHWECEASDGRIEDRYLCRDCQNRPVVITLAGYDETNTIPHYWVTQYLTTTQAPELKLSPNAKEIKHETEGEHNV